MLLYEWKRFSQKGGKGETKRFSDNIEDSVLILPPRKFVFSE